MSFLDVVKLLGGLAFFLWGMILARDGLQQAAGNKLRHMLGNMTRNRFSGLGLGAIVTFLLQSSSATTVILVGLTSAGMMAFARTVPVILGADIGTTFTVQLISFKVSHYALLLVFGGFLITQIAKRFTMRWYGYVLVGFGLIFFGMDVMSQATTPLKGSAWFMDLMQKMSESPALGILVSTVFTGIIQSSAATIGIVLALAQGGGMDISAAVSLILGANIGTCATALLATFGATVEGRRVAYAHIGIKILGVILCFPFIGPFAEFVANISGPDISRQIANAHTIFNFFLAAAFLPFSSVIANFLIKTVTEKPRENAFGPMFLDPRHLETPALALGDAERELARMGELVEKQISKSLKAFTESDLDYIQQVEEADSDIDLLNKDIKLYLARINPNNLSEEQLAREYAIVEFAAELENVGDVVTKNLMYLAKKRIQKGYHFSKEGLDELKRMHDATLEQYRLSVVVFNSKDETLARKAIESKHAVRALAQELKTNHIRRLHEAKPETIETTSLHIDMVESYLRICSTVSRAAYVFVPKKD